MALRGNQSQLPQTSLSLSLHVPYDDMYSDGYDEDLGDRGAFGATDAPEMKTFTIGHEIGHVRSLPCHALWIGKNVMVYCTLAAVFPKYESAVCTGVSYSPPPVLPCSQNLGCDHDRRGMTAQEQLDYEADGNPYGFGEIHCDK